MRNPGERGFFGSWYAVARMIRKIIHLQYPLSQNTHIFGDEIILCRELNHTGSVYELGCIIFRKKKK